MVWLATLFSVAIVSLISFVGVLTLTIRKAKLTKWLMYMVSFSAGALLGDVFFHLFPEIAADGLTTAMGLYVLIGILFSFVIEKVIHWRHCHIVTSEHTHPFAYMNLFGDAVHNFLDGLIIAGSYLVNMQVGIATTIAVILHELPQEIGDFGVLLHGGFSKSKALLVNFFTALTAVLGAVVGLLLNAYIVDFTSYLIPFAIGGLLYIATSDLIPELHKEVKASKSVMQLLTLLLGVVVMFSLLGLE